MNSCRTLCCQPTLGSLRMFAQASCIIALHLLLMPCMAAESSQQATRHEDEFSTHHPTEKCVGLVKNPGMGWVLYCDAFSQMVDPKFPNYNKGVFHPELFWKTFDECGATQKASIFYLRAPWSFFEPTKGNTHGMTPRVHITC